MSAFDLLSGASVRKPYLGFSNLRIGHYEVVKFKLVKNKLYNPNAEKPLSKLVLMVELKDQVLFLPQYFAMRDRSSCSSEVWISCNFS